MPAFMSEVTHFVLLGLFLFPVDQEIVVNVIKFWVFFKEAHLLKFLVLNHYGAKNIQL